jgi:cyclic pyranopterin phosphate synthase
MVECRDSFGRRIDYLRISVTDRCNLRCVYCAPPERFVRKTHRDILRYEEILRVVEAAAGLGIRKVRLTGGEPLVRLGLVDFARALRAVPGIAEVSLTTNGLLLESAAAPLAQAGVGRVNISLDTLQPERFARITRGGDLAQVWRGVAAAEQAGLRPIKLNMVVIRGLNDDELEAYARLSLTHPWHVRFIELMPIANQGDWGSGFPAPHTRFVAAAEIRERLAGLGELTPVAGLRGNGPAQIGRLPGAAGTVGFISALSQHFCAACNRLRLTADGWLRPCLLHEGEIDLRPTLREGADLARLQTLLLQAVRAKPPSHGGADGHPPEPRGMQAIGG